MVKWRRAAKRLSESHLGKMIKDSDMKIIAYYCPLMLCIPLVRLINYNFASDIGNLAYDCSDDMAPFKPVSAHLCIAMNDLIPEVR